MCMSFGNDADILIDPQSRNSDKYISNIRKLSVFRNVFNAKEIEILNKIRNPNKTKRKITITLSYIFLNSVIKKMFPQGFDYDTVYLSNNTFISNPIVQYVNLHKLDVDFVYYDDGEGSYDNNTVNRESSSDRFIKKVLRRSVVPAKSSKLLYSPELYNMIHPDEAETIGRVPYFNASDKIQNVIEQVFETDSIKTIEEPFIILDTMPYEVMVKEEADKYQEQIQKICDALNGKVCVKKHPRDKKMNRYGCKEYTDNSVPFEMLCLCSDFSSKTLIVLSSTSILTPKIIFNQEPHIVLLYKLFPMKSGFDDQRTKMYDSIRKIYADPSKLSIPESFEELNELISSFSAE